ncbi:hypothetical protein BDZ45DRAFT_737431 [Acephala macrosclerotiorum]|nr:hypothetical protein BDZ45DRAFT_737431 [Acephala macrosclerotiorum]
MAGVGAGLLAQTFNGGAARDKAYKTGYLSRPGLLEHVLPPASAVASPRLYIRETKLLDVPTCVVAVMDTPGLINQQCIYRRHRIKFYRRPNAGNGPGPLQAYLANSAIIPAGGLANTQAISIARE